MKALAFIVLGIFIGSTYLSWNELVSFLTTVYHHPVTQAIIGSI